jgi:hypothetical protein
MLQTDLPLAMLDLRKRRSEMNRRQVIGMVGLSAAASASPGVRERFIGVWKLVSCERKYKDGRLQYPYGQSPVGRITYDKAGRMSAQLMRPGRHSTSPPGVNLVLANASADEMREVLSGFMAYFGAFDVDEASTTVIHHVQACLLPTWVGTDLKRTYRFDSNRLHLTVVSSDNSLELIWEKESD